MPKPHEFSSELNKYDLNNKRFKVCTQQVYPYSANTNLENEINSN
jgi:hypothetical protein